MSNIQIRQRDQAMPLVKLDGRDLPGVTSITYGNDGRVEITLSIHALVEFVNEPETRVVIRTDSLDAAWAEAEAALPDGWSILITACACDDDAGQWRIAAGPNIARWADPEVYVKDAPAAALRALTAKLRERAG